MHRSPFRIDTLASPTARAFAVASVVALAPGLVAGPACAADSLSSPAPTQAVACVSSALRLRTESGDGRFDGMSHSGAVVVVQNVGDRACSLSGRPQIEFVDPAGGRLPATLSVTPHMGLGPAIVPLVLEPGTSAATTLRWQSQNVSENGVCLVSRSISLAVPGSESLEYPLRAQLCGTAGRLAFEQRPLTTRHLDLGAIAAPVAGLYALEGPGDATAMMGGQGTPAGTVTVERTKSGRLSFALNASRPEAGSGISPNVGSIEGTIPDAKRATFAAPAGSAAAPCTLAFAFYNAQLTIAQTGTCGFGYAVSATGPYRLVTVGSAKP